MTPRRKIFLLAAALAILLGGAKPWRLTQTISRPLTPHAIDNAKHRAARMPKPSAELLSVPSTPIVAAPTRGEATAFVRALYRKEQLTRELDLEQRRYGRDYWQAECSGRELAALQRAKATLLKELSAEANAVLNDLFPDEPGELIALAAIFETERPGPNVTFLSPALRARFEAEILGDDSGRAVDAERLRDIAARTLPSGDNDIYLKWNDRSAVTLRRQLLGFNPTENEFIAILRDARASEEDGEGREPTLGLEAALGPTRFAELQKLKEPTLHTAVNDLQRLGLPLDAADWLAATRARAVADIGAIWQSTALNDAAKREQVTQVERVYGQAIGAKLGLPEATLDGLEPSS